LHIRYLIPIHIPNQKKLLPIEILEARKDSSSKESVRMIEKFFKR